jgi:hypothetical protein
MMTSTPEFHLRRATSGDVHFAWRLFALTMRESIIALWGRWDEAILRAVLADASRQRSPVRLQVNRANRARRFYQRHGFKVIGETDRHYLMEASGRMCGIMPS